MRIRKLFKAIHLSLGLLSGIIVWIVCVTGCLYVFHDEIQALFEPYKSVKQQQAKVLKPSEIIKGANIAVKNTNVASITYGGKQDAVAVNYAEDDKQTSLTVYANPYTRQVLKVVKHKKGEFDFFRFILKGHRTLWLPKPIGKAIVGYAVLIFFVVLVTGIIIRLPKRWNKKSVKHLFSPRRHTKHQRFSINVHYVLSVYAVVPLLIVSFTGMMISLGWLKTGVYSLLSNGKTMQKLVVPHTDTLYVQPNQQRVCVDMLYRKITHQYPNVAQVSYQLPQTKGDVYGVMISHVKNSRYFYDYLFFDPYTLHELKGEGIKAGRYQELNTANTAMRLNRAVHDGGIFGIYTKIIMFLASLVGALLPVTGFLLWRRKKLM